MYFYLCKLFKITMKNIAIIITSCILLLASSLKAQEAITTPTLTPKTDSLRKIKEFGLGFSSLFSSSYSLQYRWGNTKRLFRVNANIGGFTAFGKTSSSSTGGDTINNSTTTNTGGTKTPLSVTSNLSFSILYLKNIVKKFGVVYGPVAGIGYSTLTTQSNSTGSVFSTSNGGYPVYNNTNYHTSTFQPYLGFVLGAFYKINRSFYLYAEIAPNVYYAHTNRATNTNSTNYNRLNYSSTNNTSTSNNAFGIANLSNSGATITIVYRITTKPKAL